MRKTLLLLLCPSIIWALEPQPNHLKKNATNEGLKKAQAHLQKTLNQKPLPLPDKKKKPIVLNTKILLANPELLKRTMQSVLTSKQIAGIKVVLPIYQKLPDAYPSLIRYAQAQLAQANGKLKKAIGLYRDLISQYPKGNIIRFDLAMALYFDKQFSAARKQFKKLQSEKMHKDDAKFIAQIIKRIDQQEKWIISSNFYYRNENNINNVPEQRGPDKIVGGDPPEKAHGYHIELGATKRFNLSKNLYSKIGFNANSDYFWDNQKYNEFILKTSAGIGYADNKLTTEITPFVKERFYRGPYSITTGIGVLFRYQLTHSLGLSNYLEWSYERFASQPLDKGQRKKLISISAVYQHNPQQYWHLGGNYLDSDAITKSNDYYSQGVFAVWGQEWPRGISSSLGVSATYKDYKQISMAPGYFYLQEDRIYGTTISLWHRKIQRWGITPHLVWKWQKTKSNHPLYRTRKNQITLEFSKTF